MGWGNVDSDKDRVLYHILMDVLSFEEEWET